MKIRLLEPQAPVMHMWSYSLYPRLGLPLIGAALANAGHDVRIYCEQIASVDWEDLRSADLVGISATTSTAPAAYAAADDLRARGIPTVIGGSHVTFMADEALDHVDYVARGEGGEALMLELIEALEGRGQLAAIRGLSYRRDGVAMHNELRDPAPDLDALPVPDLSLIAGHERMQVTPVMTSWGCPFACNFCSVTAMFGRKYRFRSAESVVAELRLRRPKRIFFYDDNFAADKRRLKDLLRQLIDAGITAPWTAQVRTDVARDPELLDLMRRSGCERLALGLESVNQATLDGYDKSQSVDDIVRAIKTLHQYGIKSHGMFVLGADTDTPETVRDTVSFARRHHIDTIMLNILTPGPGTLQFDQLDAEGRIFDKHWNLYDAQHVVFVPGQMAPVELQRETLRGYLRFYSRRRWLASLLTLRINSLKEYSWFWWFLRSWRRDKRNRAYLQRLAEVSRAPFASLATGVRGT